MQMIFQFGDQVMKTGRTFYLAGLGVAATVNQEAQKVFDQMVEKGRNSKDPVEGVSEKVQADGMIQRVKGLGDQVGNRVQDSVSYTFSRMGIPTRQEIQDLTRSVEQLTEKVQALQV